MDRQAWLAVGERLLRQAVAVRAAFGDAEVLGRVPIDARPPASSGAFEAVRAALVQLLEEMVLVQGGGAGSLVVLDDEMANPARELARL